MAFLSSWFVNGVRSCDFAVQRGRERTNVPGLTNYYFCASNVLLGCDDALSREDAYPPCRERSVCSLHLCDCCCRMGAFVPKISSDRHREPPQQSVVHEAQRSRSVRKLHTHPPPRLFQERCTARQRQGMDPRQSTSRAHFPPPDLSQRGRQHPMKVNHILHFWYKTGSFALCRAQGDRC